MPEWVYFVIDPVWARPLSRDPAGRRNLLRYKVVRKPIGAGMGQCELISKHWTWDEAVQTVRLCYALRRAAGVPNA